MANEMIMVPKTKYERLLTTQLTSEDMKTVSDTPAPSSSSKMSVYGTEDGPPGIKDINTSSSASKENVKNSMSRASTRNQIPSLKKRSKTHVYQPIKEMSRSSLDKRKKPAPKSVSKRRARNSTVETTVPSVLGRAKTNKKKTLKTNTWLTY